MKLLGKIQAQVAKMRNGPTGTGWSTEEMREELDKEHGEPHAEDEIEAVLLTLTAKRGDFFIFPKESS